MDKRSRYLIKNTSVLTIGNFSSKVLVFLLVPLYTSVLSTKEYGSYDLVATTVQMLIPILTLDVYEGAMRFVMDPDRPRDQVVSIGLKYVLIGIGLFSVILGVNAIFGFFSFAAEYAVLIWLYFVFSLLYQFASLLARGFEQVKTVAVAGVVSTAMVVGSNILLLLVFHLGLKGFFISYVISYIVPDIYLYARLKILRFIRRDTDKDLQKEMVKYSVPLILNTLGWWANTSLDKYVVTAMCGIAMNGIFSVSYKIPSILNTLQGIFVQAWQISAIKETSSDDSAEFYGTVLNVVNVAMSFCCMMLIAFTIPIAKLLFAKEFFAAWQYAPFLLLSCVINVAGGVVGPVLSAKMDSRSMGVAAVYGAVSNLIMNVALIYLIGVQGAAIATAVSSFVIFQLRYKAVGREAISCDYKKIVFPWLIMVVQCLLLIYTKLYFMQAVLIALFCLIYRNDLKTMAERVLAFVRKRQ